MNPDLITGFPVIDWFLALLEDHGYAITYGFTVFENLFVIGSFTPGETVVIGASAVSSNGHLRLAGVWLASFFGTVTGSNLTFFLGRRVGIDAVRRTLLRLAESRLGVLLRIDPSGIDDVEEHFRDRGASTVFISRFAIGAKNLIPAVAGSSRMPIFWFEVYTALGAIVYTTVMCLIGWFLGENLERALAVAQGIGVFGLVLFAVIIVAAVVTARRLRARKAARRALELAEAVEPGAVDDPS